MDKSVKNRSKRKFDIIMLIIILAVIGYLALPVPRCRPINWDSGIYAARNLDRAIRSSIYILHEDYIGKGTEYNINDIKRHTYESYTNSKNSRRYDIFSNLTYTETSITLNWKSEIYVWDYFPHNGTQEEAYIVKNLDSDF
jgi:hypothetical protein